MAKGKAPKSKEHNAAQKARTERNKARAREKHKANHPNDRQAL